MVLEIVDILKKCFIEISDLIKNKNSLDLGNVIYDQYNISGDNIKKLDDIANEILKTNLQNCELVRSIGSEEEQTLINTQYYNAPYLVCYDPLDGSSNIDVNITVGTIFAIYQYKNNQIQNGRNIVMSGYCLYGGSTQMILSFNNNINIYQLINNQFQLVKENQTCNKRGKIYSINESNKNIWLDKRFNILINKLIEQNYTTRWVASLVADAHRTLIKGGFFAYPANEKNKCGKIRLLYEAYPFAYIFETANGIASNGQISLLDIDFPKHNIHQKTPIILSSQYEYDTFHKS